MENVYCLNHTVIPNFSGFHEEELILNPEPSLHSLSYPALRRGVTQLLGPWGEETELVGTIPLLLPFSGGVSDSRGTQARSVSARQPQAPWSLWTPLALWSLHTRAHAQHHTCHSEVWLQLRGGPPSRPAGSVAPGQQPSPALPCPAVPTLRPSLCPSLSCRPTLRRTWIWPVDQVSA